MGVSQVAWFSKYLYIRVPVYMCIRYLTSTERSKKREREREKVMHG
jgi:hypothetical protein